MKKFFGCLILGLFAGLIRSQEAESSPPPPTNCIEIYRRDKMEKWIIPIGSALCQNNQTTQSGFKYGFTTFGKTMRVISKDINTSIENMYVTEKFSDRFSVSVYRPGLDYPHFLVLKVTDEELKLYNFEYEFNEESRNANFRSTYYIRAGDIEGMNGDFYLILTGVLVFLQFLVTSAGLGGDGQKYGCVYTSSVTIVMSTVMGLFQWNKRTTLCYVIAGIVVGAMIAGYFNQKKGTSMVSIGVSALMIVYYFLGGSVSHRTYTVTAMIFMFLGVFIPCFFRSSGSFGVKLVYSLQFVAFWITQFLFWSYIFLITPPELHMRVWSGPSDYLLGYKGKGIYVNWPIIVCWFGSLILFGLSTYAKFSKEKIKLTFDS